MDRLGIEKRFGIEDDSGVEEGLAVEQGPGNIKEQLGEKTRSEIKQTRSDIEKPRFGVEKPCANIGNNGSRRAFYHALADGLMCIEHKRLASSEMTHESRLLAAEMFHSPVDSFAQLTWPRARAADLRKFLVQSIERHIEKKLVTAVALGKLD